MKDSHFVSYAECVRKYVMKRITFITLGTLGMGIIINSITAKVILMGILVSQTLTYWTVLFNFDLDVDKEDYIEVIPVLIEKSLKGKHLYNIITSDSEYRVVDTMQCFNSSLDKVSKIVIAKRTSIVISVKGTE